MRMLASLALSGSLILLIGCRQSDEPVTDISHQGVQQEQSESVQPGSAAVNAKRLIAADDDPGQWMSYGRLKWLPDDIRYTRSKDNRILFATRLGWTSSPITLKSFAEAGVAGAMQIKSINLLGSNQMIKWKQEENGLVIYPPKTPVFENVDWPIMFKIEIQ